MFQSFILLLPNYLLNIVESKMVFTIIYYNNDCSESVIFILALKRYKRRMSF